MDLDRQLHAPAVMIALGALVVLFVGGAFMLGRVFADPERPTPSSTPRPTSTVAAANEVFMGFVRSRYPELANASDDILESTGSGGCKVFEGGGELSDVYARIPADSPFSTLEVAELIAVGVQSYCPQFEDKLTP
jgi:hypothetical protein